MEGKGETESGRRTDGKGKMEEELILINLSFCITFFFNPP